MQTFGLLARRRATALALSLAGCLPALAHAGESKPASRSVPPTPASPTSGGSATFTAIGFLPGDNSSEIRALSADGTVAVGASGVGPTNGLEYGRVGVKWTAGGGLVALPGIPADTSPIGTAFITASDISADGAWIAYRAQPGGNRRREAVICKGDLSQTIILGRLQTNSASAANQISDDGAVAFGFGSTSTGTHAFRWTQATGIQQLTEPPLDTSDPNNQQSRQTIPAGRACSADGSVSVGFIETDNYNVPGDVSSQLSFQAYRWTASTGAMQMLGYLPGGNRSAALAITADGATVFGVSRSTNAPGSGLDANGFWDYSGELFVWRASTGAMAPLGTPAGYNVFTNFAGASADGALFAVAASDSTHVRPDAFFVIRTATGESFNAYDLLVSGGAGASVTGWSGFTPLGMSDNGDALCGNATDPAGKFEGWVANFTPGYLRTVQVFAPPSGSRPAPSQASTIGQPDSYSLTSGAYIGRDGSYSINGLTVGDGSNAVSLTLSGSATLANNGAVSVGSTGSLNLLDGATATTTTLTLGAGSTLGVGLTPAAETSNRLTVTGSVVLSGQPTLNLILNYTPAPNTQFTVLRSASTSGQFAGVAEGQFITLGSTRLRATYHGGTSGQDFVVRVLPAVRVTTVASLSNQFALSGTAEPGATVKIESTSDLTQGFATLTTVPVNAQGGFTFTDSSSAGAGQRFYRASYGQ